MCCQRVIPQHTLGFSITIVIYAFLWHFDQAQDLLLTLNQKGSFNGFLQVPLYFFSLFVLACLIWNALKYLHYWNINKIKGYNVFKYSPDYHYEYYNNEFDREDITIEEINQLHIKYLFVPHVYLLVAIVVIAVFFTL